MIIIPILLCSVQQASTKKEHGLSKYPFNVRAVKGCPLSGEEWMSASKRLHCSPTKAYQCVPDYNLTFLIEFCYPLGDWIQIEKGHCTRLTLTGRLNNIDCSNFAYGCPDKTYYSNEIYDHPACLTVALGCFSADINCLKVRISSGKNRTSMTENTQANCTCMDQIDKNITKSRQQADMTKCDNETYIICISLMSILLVLSVLVAIVSNKQRLKGFNMKCFSKRDTNRGRQRSKQNALSECSPFIEDANGDRQRDQCETESKSLPLMEDTSGDLQRDQRRAVNNDKGIFVSFTVEDSELFFLLKRQCTNGVYIGFCYLNDTRVKKRKKHGIFLQRDEIGCTLLHYASQGGSIAILEEILKTNTGVKLGIRCFQGQSVLDYAIKYQQKEMSEFLITKHKELLQDESPQTAQDPDSICTCQGIKPFHWVAWHGDLRMFDVLKRDGVDVATETRNGLNVLDIAILRNKFEFCKHIIEYENMKYLTKRDECEWNVAHFAAYSNNVKVLQLLKSKNENLIRAKTKTKKTTLHIACEYGHFDVVAFVTEYYEDLLHCTDDLKWNALHYASKGGNLKIINLLQKKGLLITSLTGEEKTVLHIACTHKQVEICKHIVEIFYNVNRELIDKKTTNQSWMAAHYIGVEKKGDGREEKIIDILLKYEADLSKRTRQGWSVLDIAIDHLNVGLVKHLVSNKEYRTRLDISKESLLDNMKNTKDESISKILRDIVEEMTTR